jgi:hypothetical protein
MGFNSGLRRLSTKGPIVVTDLTNVVDSGSYVSVRKAGVSSILGLSLNTAVFLFPVS